jgi:hypothetical protein
MCLTESISTLVRDLRESKFANIRPKASFWRQSWCLIDDVFILGMVAGLFFNVTSLLWPRARFWSIFQVQRNGTSLTLTENTLMPPLAVMTLIVFSFPAEICIRFIFFKFKIFYFQMTWKQSLGPHLPLVLIELVHSYHPVHLSCLFSSDDMAHRQCSSLCVVYGQPYLQFKDTEWINPISGEISLDHPFTKRSDYEKWDGDEFVISEKEIDCPGSETWVFHDMFEYSFRPHKAKICKHFHRKVVETIDIPQEMAFHEASFELHFWTVFQNSLFAVTTGKLFAYETKSKEWTVVYFDDNQDLQSVQQPFAKMHSDSTSCFVFSNGKLYSINLF